MTPSPVFAPFMSWRDIGLFIRSARTDASLRRGVQDRSARAAFEAVYEDRQDPWASADPRYRYQAHKYDGIVACLPPGRHYRSALDLGCGLGLLSARLAVRADHVLGIDLAQAAIDQASERTQALPQVTYRQGDIANLPDDLVGRFDLIVIADALYYLPPPLTPAVLSTIAARITELLVPGGLLLLANHYFFALDPDSHLTNRIHRAFRAEPTLRSQLAARRCFYRVDLLARA